MSTPSDADEPASRPRGAPGPGPSAVAPASSQAALPRFRVGHVIRGKYRLERMIAKGGMGCVYLGEQLPLGRPVAVKVLIPQSYDDEFRRRFLLEASINAKLSHRHIVTVHDYGETEEGHLFMAMEYLDGEPLSRAINREVRLSPDRACLVAIQIARALRFAHEAGVVHRDLKPSNVMLLKEREEGLSSDFVKVLDFGLVKVFEDEAQPARGEELELTRAGTMLGSPRYMAPEQIRCKPVDPRTDIYSLGIIMFHMLAGRPPFIGQGSVEILNQHLRTAPPAIGDVAGDDRCPLELEVIVERCLRKPPHERYPSMEELLSELKAAYRLIVNLPLRPSESYSDDLRLPTTGPEPVTPSRVFDPGTGASLEQILTGELTPAFRIDARDTSGVRAFSGSEPSYSEAIDLRPRRGPQMALLLLALVVGSLGLTLLWPRGSIGPTAGVPPRAEGPGAPPELETSSPPASAAPRVPANPARRPRTMATSGLPQPPSRSAVPAEAPRTVSAPSSGIRRKGRSRNATFNPPRRAPAAKLPRAAPPPPKPKAEPPPPSPSLLVDEVEDDAVERPEVPIVD